jgi:hypothetical protein
MLTGEKMDYVMGFLFLARQMWSALTWFTPVTIGLLVLLVAAVAYTHAWRRVPCRARELLVLVPFLTCIVLLAWGTFMKHEDSHTLAPHWLSYMVAAILIFHIPISVVVIWKTKGYRLLASVSCLFAGWCALCAVFIAGMSVTGDWL